jgi:hypothetical protein
MQQRIYEPVAVPAHDAYRRIIMPAFLPRVVDGLEAGIRELARDLIAEFALAPGTKPELHAGASNNGILRLELAWDAASSGQGPDPRSDTPDSPVSAVPAGQPRQSRSLSCRCAFRGLPVPHRDRKYR